MSYIHFVAGIGVFLLFAAGSSAQSMPRKPTPQQFAGYYVKQQQNWQQKQLPVNSVTYKFGTANQAGYVHDFTISRVKQVTVPTPVLTTSLRAPNKYMPAPLLQPYLLQVQQQSIKDQKQSWWKDPQQAPGAEMLRNFMLSKKGS